VMSEIIIHRVHKGLPSLGHIISFSHLCLLFQHMASLVSNSFEMDARLV
jgi:hypothetical protein